MAQKGFITWWFSELKESSVNWGLPEILIGKPTSKAVVLRQQLAEAKPTTLNTVSLSYLYTSNLKCCKSSCARVQPPQDPGKPERETASGIDLEREGKKVEDKKIEERKRLIFLGLHRKPIKLQDKKFALFAEATGALPVSWGSEDAERLPVQVLETRADKWTQGAPMLQGISLKKRRRGRERERKIERRKNTGWPSFCKAQKLYFSKGTFIPCLIYRGKWKMQGHTESAQTFQQYCPYRNQDFSAYLFHKRCCVQYLLALEACEHFMTLFW